MSQNNNFVLFGACVLVAAVILIVFGSLLASNITNAAKLPAGNSFNVSTVTAKSYGQDVGIVYLGVLSLIGLPILGMLIGYFFMGSRDVYR